MRKFNPRLVALGVVGLVAGVVLITDLTGHSGGGSTPPAGSVYAVPHGAASIDDPSSDPGPAATSSPAAPASATTNNNDDDGIGDAPATATPTTDPAATEAVTAFAAAWLNTYGRTDDQWRTGIVERVTADLAADLHDADPSTVPAGGRVGQVKMRLDGQLTVADVQVVTAGGPKQTLGTLHLSVVNRGGWKISEIDWEGPR
jgi:hypothetical protein